MLKRFSPDKGFGHLDFDRVRDLFEPSLLVPTVKPVLFLLESKVLELNSSLV